MRPYLISRTWRITAQPNYYALEHKVGTKGKLRWETRGYYSKISEALAAYLNVSPRTSEKDLPDALSQAIRNVQKAAGFLRASLSVTL